VYLLDVNVVLAAHRDDHPQHAAVRPWFDRLMASDDPFTVPC
jgi:predicted nucleic acid-binding protein